MCSVDLTSFMLYVNRQTSLTLTLYDSNRTVCQDGKYRIDVCLVNNCGNSIEGDVEPLSQGQVKILLTPERRRQHQLNVKVNGAHIKNSPFKVTVYMPPKLMSQPVATVTGMSRPGSLIYSQAENKVFATVIKEGTIIKVDSQFHIIQGEVINLPLACEITQGADLNIFYATTTNNQVHKMSNDGKIIKSVGQFGNKNAEFNYPNGLRVRKNHELYVCDSDNNRVQIFDLNLNFKRSFGKRGSGKGQLNWPTDVDFDLSGNIYVVDFKNHRIQVFTYAEQYIRLITPMQQSIFGIIIFLPVSLLMHNENIYVTDIFHHKVWVMNTSGETIATFGGGFLRNPEGITVDKAGFIYITSHLSKIVVF